MDKVYGWAMMATALAALGIELLLVERGPWTPLLASGALAGCVFCALVTIVEGVRNA